MMSKFRTTEISDPQFESNRLRFITVKSQNLKGRGDICVFVPDVPEVNDLPIVILLHGVYGSSWAWAFKGGAHHTAQRLITNGQIKPMILAMPSDGLWGDGSGYLPHNSLDFEKWICEDVPIAIQENIQSGASNNSTLFIGGLSMGGFGALRIGAKYASKFKAISGHSAITSVEQMKEFIEEPISSFKQADSTDEDVFETMQKNKAHLPPIRFDCGTSDPLIQYNRVLSKKLSKSGISHIYEEFDGDHEWSYWQEHLADTLKFFNRQLLSSV